MSLFIPGTVGVILSRSYQDTIIMTHVTITIHHYCLDSCGSCDNGHHLGHVKNVCDDDDNDIACFLSSVNKRLVLQLQRLLRVFSF